MPGILRGAKRERVIAEWLLRRAWMRLAVAEAQRDAALVVPRHHPHWPVYRASALLDPDLIAVVQLAVCSQPGADQDDVAPGDLGKRLRQLLQPGIVGEP